MHLIFVTKDRQASSCLPEENRVVLTGEMKLVYNVHYEVAAAAFLVVIYFYLCVQYSARSVTTDRFKKLIFAVLVADIMDILTAVDISYASELPNWFNVFSNTFYFITVLIMMGNYIKYIGTYASDGYSKLNKRINHVLYALYVIIYIVGMFTGVTIGFSDKGEYIHGPLYYTSHMFSIYCIIDGLFLVIKNRKRVPQKQINAVFFFSAMEILGCTVQILFFPDILLSIFGGAVSMAMITFALETPDYRNLTRAMEELEENKLELEIAKKEAEKAKEEAENANKAKSAFLASMSHEIRTPINGVLGMNSIILKESQEPYTLECAQNIDNAGNGLLSLINDILDFSKIESGKMEINSVEYVLSNVLSSCYNMVFLRARDKGIDLIFENNPTTPNKLFGDELRIRQIIVNLLTNAIKYTEEGSVLMTVDWEKGEADMMTLVVSVKDTGMGIRQEDLGTLFEAFSRINIKKNRTIEGTGLGLKITKQFLDLMNGTIEVDSVYGRGSEFTIRIPQRIVTDDVLGNYADYSRLSTDDNPEVIDKFVCPNGRILAVDDVPMNLKVIVGLLKETKLKIDTAASGFECLDMVQKTKYDVVLLDHMMPEMDGMETLEKMRNCSSMLNPSVPVIMLTANAVTGAREEYLAAGFTDYLSKPIKEADLNAMLLKYLPKELVELKSSASEKEPDETDYTENNETGNTNCEKIDVDVKKGETKMSDFEQRYSFLDTELGLSYCMNDEEFYEEVIVEYRNTGKYDEIKELFESENWKDYAVYVHGVKSSSLTIGAKEVSEMAKALELAAKDGNIDFVNANHHEFMRKYGELLDNLDNACN